MSYFSSHRLHDTNISIYSPTNEPPKKRNPEIGRNTHAEEGDQGSYAAKQKDRLSTYPIREAPPEGRK